jgi:type I restriction enzyme S subunit
LLRSITPYIQLVGDGKGSGKPIINKTEFSKIKVTVPDLNTQKIVAPILSAYDDLIEVNNQRIKLLEETARELYKEWFVRMRFPRYKKAKFVKGVPEGWTAGCIGDLYSVKSGFAFKGELLGAIGVPIIKITNIQDNGIDIHNCDRYSGEINKRIEKFELKDGDLLIAMTGAQIGKIGLIADMSERYFLNQRVGKFFPKKDILTNNAFAYFNSTSEYFRAMIENYAMGAAQPNISGEQIEKIACFVPSDTLLKQFTEICDPIFQQVSILKSQNTQLRQIRDRLLPRLISGKLEVKINIILNQSEQD